MRSWMGTRISLGRIAGVEVGFTWSFLVILGLFVVSLAAGVFPVSNPGLGTATYIAMGVVAAVLFFVSILLHELAHSVQARREGMQVSGITLWRAISMQSRAGLGGASGSTRGCSRSVRRP